MKKFAFILLLAATVFIPGCGGGTGKNSGSSQSSETGIAGIVFKEYEHNFGEVTEGEKIGYTFTFENNGAGNLIISSATTSCGCTVPKYDTKPIAPGGTGNIEVVFDTYGRSGMQTKTISVHSNASVPVVLLKITAIVKTNDNN